jgi:hypothetical protein
MYLSMYHGYLCVNGKNNDKIKIPTYLPLYYGRTTFADVSMFENMFYPWLKYTVSLVIRKS